MKKEQAAKQIAKLSDQIEAHNHKYYVLDQPTISDKEYDDLLKKLIDLEKQFPDLVDANSPSQRVGSKIDAQGKNITHRV